MIHSFNDFYINDVQRNLAVVVDYLNRSCKLSNAKLQKILSESRHVSFLTRGHPSYAGGKSGIEIAKLIKEEFQLKEVKPYDFPFEHSAFYWAGFVLAYYSWYTCKSLSYIFYSSDLDYVIKMYPCYHEMDVMHFVNDFDYAVFKGFKETNLKLIRMINNYSQSELARISHVSLRSIQLYEQRVNDINKAQVGSLLKLSNALNVDIKDLLETEIIK